MTNSESRPTLSVVIPAFNEEKRIIGSLQKIDLYLSRQPYKSELIVVDDCSTDGTRRAVRSYMGGRADMALIALEKNLGKGGAVKKGVSVATGSYVLFTDADLSTPIEMLDSFFKLIKPASPAAGSDYDVVIGSRRVKGASLEIRQPFRREASGRIFSLLVRAVVLRGFLDTQCGFKMFTAQAARDIFSRQTLADFGFDVELLFIARHLGLKIKEAPVVWYDSPLTRVRFFRDSWHMFLDLWTIRRQNRLGKYR